MNIPISQLVTLGNPNENDTIGLQGLIGTDGFVFRVVWLV